MLLEDGQTLLVGAKGDAGNQLDGLSEGDKLHVTGAHVSDGDLVAHGVDNARFLLFGVLAVVIKERHRILKLVTLAHKVGAEGVPLGID